MHLFNNLTSNNYKKYMPHFKLPDCGSCLADSVIDVGPVGIHGYSFSEGTRNMLWLPPFPRLCHHGGWAACPAEQHHLPYSFASILIILSMSVYPRPFISSISFRVMPNPHTHTKFSCERSIKRSR